MSVLKRIAAVTVVVALVACGGDKTSPKRDTASTLVDSSAVTGAPLAAFTDNVGEAESTPCSIQASGGCIGSTDIALVTKPTDAARFVKAVDEDPKGWGSPSSEIDRYTVDGGKNARLQLRTIGDSKQIAFKNIANLAMLIGRVDVISISGTEKFFNISPDDAKKANNRFYVIETGFKKGEKTADSLITFGKWRLYGVVGGQLKAFGKIRDFSGCVIPHPDRTQTARFTTCLKAARLHVYETNPAFTALAQKVAASATAPTRTLLDVIRSALPKNATGTIGDQDVLAALKELQVDSSQLTPAQITEITQLLVDEAGDPFWMTCGIGCCTTGI